MTRDRALPARTRKGRAFGGMRTGSDLVVLAAQLALPNARLARLGWDLRAIEVDSVARRVDVQAHHTSGRWVHLRIEDRGATLDRWQRAVTLRRPDDGYGPAREHVEDVFLGRLRIANKVQGAMRALADYMSDHADVTRQLGRDAVRPALLAFLVAVEVDQ